MTPAFSLEARVGTRVKEKHSGGTLKHPPILYMHTGHPLNTSLPYVRCYPLELSIRYLKTFFLTQTFKARCFTYIFVIYTLHENKLSVGSFSMGLILKWPA